MILWWWFWERGNEIQFPVGFSPGFSMPPPGDQRENAECFLVPKIEEEINQWDRKKMGSVKKDGERWEGACDVEDNWFDTFFSWLGL